MSTSQIEAAGITRKETRSNERTRTDCESKKTRKAQGERCEIRSLRGEGSHGILSVDRRKTTVKDRKREIGAGLLRQMLADLGIDRDEL